MTREELLKKIDFEKSWLYDCGVFGSDVDIAFNTIKNRVIEALEQEECDDCISRKEALKLFEDRFIELQMAHRKDTQYGVNWCINTLKDLPSVRPKEKVGHWVRVDDTKVKCSNCDVTHFIAQYPIGGINYCPNCGCRMVEPHESEDTE